MPGHPTPVTRMTFAVLALGAILVLCCVAVAGLPSASSSVIGVAVAVGNLHLLAWIVRKVTSRQVRNKAGLMLLLILKLTGLMAVVGILIRFQIVQPIPFTVGLTSLVGGLITASLFTQPVEGEEG